MLRNKIDGFYLVHPIGTGGMAEVFLGINPKSHEKRAFKMLRKSASINPSVYARFLREIEIIRGLSHPGIMRVIDSGTLEECFFYSMEYMPGGNLNRRLERGKLTIETASELFGTVCSAMAYAHDNGILHRDLKPSNILLRNDGSPIVSDFGIAKMLNSEKSTLTHSGEILGTIAYLAPEQRVNAQDVNRRADVYALGAIFYEMIMGFPPLGNFPRPAEIYPGFPLTLQSILNRCLSTDPEARFEHAGSLLQELEKSGALPSRLGCFAKPAGVPLKEPSTIVDERDLTFSKTDRIETWFRILRTGTTRERLATVRKMVDKMSAAEAKAIVKIYPEEGDRVRWGLIRVFGELRMESAIPLIRNDLRNSFHTECGIEALGKIGSAEAYDVLHDYVAEHPEYAAVAMMPLAKTGKQRAVGDLQRYLNHEMAFLRQTAVKALGTIPFEEALQILKDQLRIECDPKVRVSLIQAVHSLQAILAPDTITLPQRETMNLERQDFH
jgi:tRNA A-37 threonylcarbamoyl transferase component Bud32